MNTQNLNPADLNFLNELQSALNQALLNGSKDDIASAKEDLFLFKSDLIKEGKA